MSHAIYTYGNWVDSWLLMVRSQIANLTPGPSFSHNLCFRCPNDQCEPILNIYVPRAFQWYKELLKPLNFDFCYCPLKIWESTGTPTPKMELPWGVRVHSLTPSHTPGSMLCDSRLPFWPVTLQTLALVASPRLQLRHNVLRGHLHLGQLHVNKWTVGFEACHQPMPDQGYLVDCQRCIVWDIELNIIVVLLGNVLLQRENVWHYCERT
jgi:hypothetical protein